MNVPASSPVLGDSEWAAMHRAVDRHWLTAGEDNRAFEQRLATYTGIPFVRTCNSGSSANLLAVAAMVEAGYWKAGDEIITPAACFPTTVNPLLLYGLVPVFVDIDLMTYNANVEEMELALTERTRGVMMAHTLGNPFDLSEIETLASGSALHFVEDCCDALGATYRGRHVGQFGSIATCSFFPAHHITTGEGGAVWTKDFDLSRTLETVRDWGRDCWCEPGNNNTCGKRFDQQFGDLPHGYDHKYTMTALGFNLKMTEIQAACGLAQMDRLEGFIDSRRRNWEFLRDRLERYTDRMILPEATPNSEPSWFGFMVTLRESGLRAGMQQYLAQNGVDSRLLFAGNITRQPYMNGRNYRIASSLENTDKVMRDGFWIGCWPGLSEEQLDYAAEMIGNYLGDFA